MIVQKIHEENPDLIVTWSDAGKYIIQDETGVKYESATDPVMMFRTYTESDEDIPVETDEPKEDIPVAEAVEDGILR